MTDEPSNVGASAEGEDFASEYARTKGWFEANIPEFYSDTININITPYGMAITFGIRQIDGAPSPKARVFLSHQMGDVLGRLLRKLLLAFERDNGVTIQVAPQVLEGLGITNEELDALAREVANG